MQRAGRFIALGVLLWGWAGPTPIATGQTGTSSPATPPAPQEENQEDEWQGLPPGEGRAVTLGLCDACHSIKLVVQQGLTRDSWDEVIDYMVAKQAMPALDAETRKLIVDYLAKNYGPKRRKRRRLP